jgi:hypothetical protein
MPTIDVAGAVTTLAKARQRYVYGLEKVPDEQLNQSASETAKSPLQMAGMTSGFLSRVALMVQGAELPPRGGAQPPAPESREAAIAAVDAAFRKLEQAIADLKDEDMDRELPVPWGGTVPLKQMMWFLMGVPGYLQGQLNYAQTIYGDMAPNIPPSWMSQ